MTLQYRGTNLCGGDTAYTDWVGGSPVSGTHYNFVSTQDVDYYLSKGANCFRLVFSWEAIQPTPKAVIPGTGNFGTYYAKFKAVVDYITSKGASVIIDVHPGMDADFAAYYGVKIGGTFQGYTVEALFVDLWSRLAVIFKGNSRVMFGIANEPSNMTASVWFAAAQKVITAIRAAGATNTIWMPGVDYTGASSWAITSGPGWDAAGLKDPANNLGFQVHLYFDSSAGGGSTDIVNASIGVTRMSAAVAWARNRGLKMFVAEVGMSANNSLAASAWKTLSDYMDVNADVVAGFTWWAAGPPSWWGGYQFTLCPSSNYTVDSLQMKLIASSLAAPAVVTPAPVVPPPAVDIVALQAALTKAQADLAAANTALAAANKQLSVESAALAAAQTKIANAVTALS